MATAPSDTGLIADAPRSQAYRRIVVMIGGVAQIA
ncbi:hypothetical protein OI25_6876 [Paraburkholderia fungorum]|uniref:Uncharacterized protein n=1 Tax=Paraburkholderia fungorum TaxID=134537 RepID=A0AAU8TJ27_9BURK|nr:hypothetical protein OI25_6876 [Paraburkholderia fungorum]